MDQVLQDLLDELAEHNARKSSAPPLTGGATGLDPTVTPSGVRKSSEGSVVPIPPQSVRVLRQEMSKSSFEFKKRMCVASLKSNKKNSNIQSQFGMDDLSSPRSRRGLHHPNNVTRFRPKT